MEKNQNFFDPYNFNMPPHMQAQMMMQNTDIPPVEMPANPTMYYEQQCMYYKYLCQMLDYKMKLREWENQNKEKNK